MKWNRKTFWGSEAEKRRVELVRELSAGHAVRDLFLVSLPTTSNGQLEIHPAGFLTHQTDVWKDVTVVGVGLGETEAKELVARIAQETLDRTGGLDLLTYVRS